VTLLVFAAHGLGLLLLPSLFIGLLNRTKAVWAGRKGPPLFQSLYDALRLLRKRPIYGQVTTPIFQLGPLVLLASALVSSAFVPLFGGRALLPFTLDFVVLAYLWGLGRVALMLAALDTGSSFEGMGASREATYSALAEPVLFLALGALGLATGRRSLDEMLHVNLSTLDGLVIGIASFVVLFIVLQVEGGRMPIDDPTTHLELTMIHEVMVLDHSGPELAFIQYASALKLTLSAAALATLINPMRGSGNAWATAATNLVLILSVAILLGCVESLVARLKLRAIPQYLLAGFIAATVALLLAGWRVGAGA
jgi:formate hydrogenlyase subunit 4